MPFAHAKLAGRIRPPALVYLAVALAFKIGGYGYGWCDVVFSFFLAAAVVAFFRK